MNGRRKSSALTKTKLIISWRVGDSDLIGSLAARSLARPTTTSRWRDNLARASTLWLSVISIQSSLRRSIYLPLFISPLDGKGMSFGRESSWITKETVSWCSSLNVFCHRLEISSPPTLPSWNSVETLVALGLLVAAAAVTTSRWIYVLLEKSSKRDKRWRLSGALKRSGLVGGPQIKHVIND